MTKQWYEYSPGLQFGEGDSGIGGEHGADFNTPLFTPITALLPGTISGTNTNVGYGHVVTWELDTLYRDRVTHMYNIHLAAIAPGIQRGVHITAGTLIGYSGGATPASVARDLANTPYHLPAGLVNHLDDPDQSYGAHVEVGFTYNTVYGEGEGFFPGYLAEHPELDPREFLGHIMLHGVQEEIPMLDIQEAMEYFREKAENVWRCTKPGHEFDVHDGILSFYRRFGGNAHNGLTYLGLPLSSEISYPDHPHATFQLFERAVVYYDPGNKIDHPPGAGDVYLAHLDSVPHVPGQ